MTSTDRLRQVLDPAAWGPALDEAVHALSRGGLVVLPTDAQSLDLIRRCIQQRSKDGAAFSNAFKRFRGQVRYLTLSTFRATMIRMGINIPEPVRPQHAMHCELFATLTHCPHLPVCCLASSTMKRCSTCSTMTEVEPLTSRNSPTG